MKTAFVTGSAGFIGYHLCDRLLAAGWRVIGFDAMNAYYDVGLKQARHARLSAQDHFTPVVARLEERGRLTALFADHQPQIVLHLAGQAGVRHSIEAPRDYVDANLTGMVELLEAARAHPPEHLLLASSSSVYGANTKVPYAETDCADTQMSFYAATKKAGEAMAHSYAHLYGLPTTLFRFFTVYGPWGRPDMAHFKFTRAILDGTPIDVYNHGRMQRDFTYINDLVDRILGLMQVIPGATPVSGQDSLSPVAPCRIVNIGANAPVPLMAFIAAIETACGREADKIMYPMQPGDVPATRADTRLLQTLVGDRTHTPLATGVQAFVDWYRDYYRV